MAFRSTGLAVVAIATAMIANGSHQAVAKNNNSAVGAAIVGGIAGVAIGAALSDQHKHKTKVYYNGYAPPYGAGGYDPYFNRAFSPGGDVVCYPAQAMCYNNNGSVARNWTRRIYGY